MPYGIGRVHPLPRVTAEHSDVTALDLKLDWQMAWADTRLGSDRPELSQSRNASQPSLASTLFQHPIGQGIRRRGKGRSVPTRVSRDHGCLDGSRWLCDGLVGDPADCACLKEPDSRNQSLRVRPTPFGPLRRSKVPARLPELGPLCSDVPVPNF